MRAEGKAAPVAASLSPVARDYPSRAFGDHFRPPGCDCSIKERVGQCGLVPGIEVFLLNKFFTSENGE
jgi:hypothetical protein